MQEKDSKPSQKWKLWSGLGSLFLSGILIGALTTGLYARHRVEHSLHQGASGVRQMVVKKLVSELKLTEIQKESLEKIVCRTQAELHRLRQSHRPEFEGVVDRSVAEMKKDLTPGQQAKLDVLVEKARSRWENHGKARHGATSCE
ncbi:MAG: hypothetical protein ABFD98_07305 [Syntrophobacteraceae bacterium]|nr:hypothetical protein [Desulfobacteraceae bacterium]